jgi:urease accessory protein
MSALDRLSLIQWLSPAFPTGGFAYSHGLEQAMARVCAMPRRWPIGSVACAARGGGWTDAVILSLTLRGEDADELADLARAMAGSAERLAETMDQGRAFAATVAALTGRDMPPRPLPVAVGVAARGLALPADEVIAHYLHGFAANLIGRDAFSAAGTGAGADGAGRAASADCAKRRPRRRGGSRGAWKPAAPAPIWRRCAMKP